MNDFPKPSVLFIDDDPDTLVSFKFQFQDTYDIFLAESANEAYNILKKENIQVVLADQYMPETSGTDFFCKIVNEYPKIIRLIVTASNDYNSVVEAINNAKVHHYFHKPWDEDEIRLTISKILSEVR